jgi:hypothetical protein
MCDSKWKGGIAVYFARAAVEVHKFVLQKKGKNVWFDIFSDIKVPQIERKHNRKNYGKKLPPKLRSNE